MATPLSADRLVFALRAEGVRVVEYRSWRTHNRNHKGPWGPVHGVVIHHTAGSNSLSLCYDGTSDLPGPLCHTHLSKAGLAAMISAGRANHAGTFAANAYDAMLNERTVHPRPDPAEPVDGNRHCYGIEIENLGNGRDPYPEVQYDQAVRWAAALCRAHGWSADSVIGHKEGTRRKIDPSFDMNAFRKAVAERLKHPASWNPTDPSEEDDPMAGMTKQDIYDAVWKTDAVAAPDSAEDRATNRTWQPQSYLKDIGNRVRRMDGQIVALTEANKRLVDTVAQLAASMGDLDPAAIVAELTSALESIDIRLDVPDTPAAT